jgi:hypothetical protein
MGTPSRFGNCRVVDFRLAVIEYAVDSPIFLGQATCGGSCALYAIEKLPAENHIAQQGPANPTRQQTTDDSHQWRSEIIQPAFTFHAYPHHYTLKQKYLISR